MDVWEYGYLVFFYTLRINPEVGKIVPISGPEAAVGVSAEGIALLFCASKLDVFNQLGALGWIIDKPMADPSLAPFRWRDDPSWQDSIFKETIRREIPDLGALRLSSWHNMRRSVGPSPTLAG